jgi:anti-anti-sigma factor
MAVGPAADRLRVDTASYGGVAVVTLRGEADRHTAPLLRDTLGRFVADDVVAVDLRPLDALDSSGMALLLMLARRLGGNLLFVVGDEEVTLAEQMVVSMGLARERTLLRLAGDVDTAERIVSSLSSLLQRTAA